MSALSEWSSKRDQRLADVAREIEIAEASIGDALLSLVRVCHRHKDLLVLDQDTKVSVLDGINLLSREVEYQCRKAELTRKRHITQAHDFVTLALYCQPTVPDGRVDPSYANCRWAIENQVIIKAEQGTNGMLLVKQAYKDLRKWGHEPADIHFEREVGNFTQGSGDT
jgi:hypothetical protein